MTNSQKERTNPDQEISSDNQIVSQENSLANDYDIDAYLDKRSEFITKVNKIMVEGKDFHLIQNRKSMAKGGAEKIAAIFGWQAMFLPDDDTIKMLGTDKGVIAYICRLQKGSHFIGEGRGARSLAQDKGDVNKAIKMASKSAFVDAVLRSSGLSDFYTQDLENMNLESHQTPNSAPTATNQPEPGNSASKEIKATTKQLGFIKGLLAKKNVKTVDINGYMFSEEDLQKLSISQAKVVIDKLLAMLDQDELPTIEIEEPKSAPYNYPEGD